MFNTHESSRIDLFGLIEKEYGLWQMVERDIHAPWYHVSVSGFIGGEKASKVLMPGDESMFEKVLALQNEEIQVTDVEVVTPAWVNGQGRWMMERLFKLETGFDKDGGLIHIISVESGAVYSGQHRGSCVAADLLDARVIYCRP